MSDTLLHDAATRLLGDLATPSLVNAAEAGIWPDALWHAVEEAGFLDALIAVDAPGSLAGLPDAATILRAAGRHAVPLPIAETMLARFARHAAGLPPGAGPATILPVEHDDTLTIEPAAGGWHVSGLARQVPWGRQAKQLVAVAGNFIVQMAPGDIDIRPGVNLAGEARDEIACDATLGAGAKLPAGIDRTLLYHLGALCRAAQIAGALEGALAMATQYASDRVQFGRPIGKFQAIQQQLAILAEQAAAADVAVSSATALAASGGDLLFAAAIAKIRAGEAAGKVSEIAHQV
ncbi:MAG: acyl-CoA dehydrogenase, partial [Alphaproteobacteria bacterium]|nr:acyl-CoA dehydrogenase [Alphaproteobacteria bacterium]